MIRWLTGLVLVIATGVASATRLPEDFQLKDLFFGEVLYFAFQKDYFNAITRLDTELKQYQAEDEPLLDPLHYNIDQAEFAVGDLEISYRMHRHAAEMLNDIFDSGVDEAIRNEAAYRMAKVYFNKNDPVNALHILERIKGKLPPDVQQKETYLRAQVDIATGRFSEAVTLLQKLKDDPPFKGFASYNLAIALIQNGQEKEGIAQLEQVGLLQDSDDTLKALRDKANLTLGYRMLEKGSPELANQYLSRVRLKGPFSNRALLGAGWVQASLGHYEKSLVPWSLLHDRDITDTSVQEVMLAVPYAYGRLDYYGKAAILYGKAMDNFGYEIDRLTQSITSIRQGKFLTAILDDQSRKDKYWLIHLRDLPDTPETRYLLQLMASHDFQQQLKNYRELAELRINVKNWLKSLDVFEQMIAIRRAYYEPLLPKIEKAFKKLDSRMRLRLAQRDRLDQRLKAMLVSRRPEYLATVDERDAIDRLNRIKLQIESGKLRLNADTQARIDRLRGILDWRIKTEYDKRLTDAYEHLHQLDEYIQRLQKSYQSFVRTRQAATQSYEGYNIAIRQKRTQLQQVQLKLTGIMARQGRMLETMAVNELDKRRARLEEYQVKARFALAESYDRATKKQQDELKQEIESQQKTPESTENKSQQEQPQQDQSQPDSSQQRIEQQ